MFRKKGFTLLELIIVIIVIGILASIALPRYLKVAERGRYAEAKNVLGMLRSAQIRYQAQQGNLAGDMTNLTDLDMTTPKYFEVTQIITASDDLVAEVIRNTEECPSDMTGYIVTIGVDGNITCTAGSGGHCPEE